VNILLEINSEMIRSLECRLGKPEEMDVRVRQTEAAVKELDK
jgi:hypothetical protein